MLNVLKLMVGTDRDRPSLSRPCRHYVTIMKFFRKESFAVSQFYSIIINRQFVIVQTVILRKKVLYNVLFQIMRCIKFKKLVKKSFTSIFPPYRGWDGTSSAISLQPNRWLLPRGLNGACKYYASTWDRFYGANLLQTILQVPTYQSLELLRISHHWFFIIRKRGDWISEIVSGCRWIEHTMKFL